VRWMVVDRQHHALRGAAAGALRIHAPGQLQDLENLRPSSCSIPSSERRATLLSVARNRIDPAPGVSRTLLSFPAPSA